jgi:hypothetical protein
MAAVASAPTTHQARTPQVGQPLSRRLRRPVCLRISVLPSVLALQLSHVLAVPAVLLDVAQVGRHLLRQQLHLREGGRRC